MTSISDNTNRNTMIQQNNQINQRLITGQQQIQRDLNKKYPQNTENTYLLSSEQNNMKQQKSQDQSNHQLQNLKEKKINGQQIDSETFKSFLQSTLKKQQIQSKKSNSNLDFQNTRTNNQKKHLDQIPKAWVDYYDKKQQELESQKPKFKYQQELGIGNLEAGKFQSVLSMLNTQMQNLDSVLGKVKNKQQTQFYQEGENHSLENKSQYRVKQNIQYLSDQKILQKEKEKEKQEKMNFWKLNSGEYLERKYRSLTNQGYMDDQTYKKIMGLKPINNVEKLKKRRKNYSLHQNSNYKPQDILYQYLYNQNEGLPLNDVQQIFLDKELDLVNKKKIIPGYMQALKVTHPDQAQIEENEHQQQKIDEFANNYQFPNMIGLGSQNPSTFEPRYKYMKYFRHNDQLLNMESAAAKRSITQIQTPQYTQGTSFYGKFNSNSVNDSFSEEKTLPRTFYKPKKPNSTLQQQLQDDPEKEVPVVYEGNVYKRYDTKYKAQLESAFNISFDRKFDPYYNKNKEIEHMEPLKRKQEREQYIGGFNPNQTYVDSAENNIYYPKRPINSSANNLLNFSNSYSKTQRQLESKSVQHHNCRKPCCYPKLDQKNLVYNPDFLASLPDKYQGMSSTRSQSQTKTNKFRNQIKLNKTSFSNNFRVNNNINKINNNNQKSIQRQRQSPINNYEVVSDDMHKVMEGEYYLNYDKQIQEQSKETLALLDSVFAQGGTYNKQEMCTLLNDFKKKYGVLAEMQDRKINVLKKEYYHNLKFNLES